MARHNEHGQWGEDQAAQYLIGQGHSIRHRNWRHQSLEIDIISVSPRQELVVTEVKTRSDAVFGQPHEAVTPAKVERTVRATQAYMETFDIDLPVRFDIVSITGTAARFDLEHWVDAFRPPLYE